MAILASRKHSLSGRNWTDLYTWSWLGNLGIYRLTGTVRYPAAHALQSTMSEGRVRENRMHGLGAAGEVDSRCGDLWSRAGALRSRRDGLVET